MQRVIEPGSKALMEQVGTRPVAGIKCIEQGMQRGDTTLYQRFDSAILCECHVIIQPKQSQDVSLEDMRGGIDGYLLKKGVVVPKRCADPAIEYIQLKGAHSAASCV